VHQWGENFFFDSHTTQLCAYEVCVIYLARPVVYGPKLTRDLPLRLRTVDGEELQPQERVILRCR
jgi:hypothetical protein